MFVVRKNKVGFLIACASVLALQVTSAQSDSRYVVKGVGFATPESVEYDLENDVYLVSNINGHPLAADGNGFVSKLSPSGDVVDLKWLTSRVGEFTLHAPKGLAISDGQLFVADLTEIHVFKLPTGEYLSTISIPGASVLNGLSPTTDGSVIVTDTGYKMEGESISPADTEALYQVWPDGQVDTIYQNGTIGHPNGVFYANPDEILVATFGSGKLLKFNLNGEVEEMKKPPSGTLDGVEKLADGRILVSSWKGDAIYALGNDGTYSVVLESVEDPADLGFDSKRQRLLVPLTNSDRVGIYEISE